MKPDSRPNPISCSMSDTSLDHEIETILAVDPSPEFVSRARTRIAATAAPSVWTMGWSGLAVGSVAVAVFVAIVISRPNELVQPETVGPTLTRSLRANAQPDDEPASDVASLKVPAVRKKQVSKVAFREPNFREPKLLISTREAAATRRFLASPQPERVELSFLTIEPQPLPEFVFIPPPVFDPVVVPHGDFQ